MLKAFCNPSTGRYVLYVGDARGSSFYVAGVRGTVDLYCRPAAKFVELFPENHPEHLSTVVRSFSEEVPDGWVVTAKAGEQIAWASKILRKSPQGEITMAELKNQPKLSAGKKPETTKVGAAAPPKPSKALPVEAKPAKSAPKAEKEAGEGGRKNPYAGMKITVVTKEIAAREGSLRHAVISAILKAKKVDDVYGTEISSADGKSGTVNTAWLNFAKASGYVDFSA